MDKVLAQYKCGHHTVVDLRGIDDPESAERIIGEYKSSLCDICKARAWADENGLVPVEMHYGEYRDHYSKYEIEPDSYDGIAKTVIVFLPPDVAEEQKIPHVKASVEDRHLYVRLDHGYHHPRGQWVNTPDRISDAFAERFGASVPTRHLVTKDKGYLYFRYDLRAGVEPPTLPDYCS